MSGRRSVRFVDQVFNENKWIYFYAFGFKKALNSTHCDVLNKTGRLKDVSSVVHQIFWCMALKRGSALNVNKTLGELKSTRAARVVNKHGGVGEIEPHRRRVGGNERHADVLEK